MTGYSFLVIKNHINSIFEKSSCKQLLSVTNSANSSCGYNGSCVASWNFNCAWFADPTLPESNSEVFLKLCEALL